MIVFPGQTFWPYHLKKVSTVSDSHKKKHSTQKSEKQVTWNKGIAKSIGLVIWQHCQLKITFTTAVTVTTITTPTTSTFPRTPASKSCPIPSKHHFLFLHIVMHKCTLTNVLCVFQNLTSLGYHLAALPVDVRWVRNRLTQGIHTGQR